jgi:hypothetical protein
MPPATIDFTPHRDAKGYRLMPGKTPRLRPGQSEIDLLKTRAIDIQPDRIKGLGGKLVSVPFEQYPPLFCKFAGVESAEELLRFITQFGPLTNAGMAEGPGDVVPHLLDQAEQMRARLKPGVATDIPLTNLKAWVSKDRRTGQVMVITGPATLLDALWLQLGYTLSGGAKITKCRHCDEYFPVGMDTDRRLDATFCTEEHRKRFFSLKRSERT